jgi:hypothetical protein
MVPGGTDGEMRTSTSAGASGTQSAAPIEWLLEDDNPAVRHATLRNLLDRPADDPEVSAARSAAMSADPIASILAAQQPDGFWEKPGAGYATKYRGTVWQLIFLDQLYADPLHPGVVRAASTSWGTARHQPVASAPRAGSRVHRHRWPSSTA